MRKFSSTPLHMHMHIHMHMPLVCGVGQCNAHKHRVQQQSWHVFTAQESKVVLSCCLRGNCALKAYRQFCTSHEQRRANKAYFLLALSLQFIFLLVCLSVLLAQETDCTLTAGLDVCKDSMLCRGVKTNLLLSKRRAKCRIRFIVVICCKAGKGQALDGRTSCTCFNQLLSPDIPGLPAGAAESGSVTFS
jgi:hypothetical protein